MFLRAAGCSNVGMKRRVNEDRYAIAPDLGLFLVADGMGGHTGGQLASELATGAALRAIRGLQGSDTSPGDKLRHAVQCANRRVLEEAQTRPDLAGMGTTLVMLMASGTGATLAHVGDSRAYLVCDGQIRCLTEDHSLVGELIRRGELTVSAAREHPHRHVLTRAIGVNEEVSAEIGELQIVPGDVFVLCSDGLTTHLLDEEIAGLVAGQPDLKQACHELVDAANGRGGQDNTTVIMLRYDCERDAASTGP